MDSTFVINTYLYARGGQIDPNKELIPVATLGANQFVLSLNPGYKFASLKDFVEFAKKAKPPLAYASAGNGSQHHLTMEMLKARAGFDMLHVPYKGGTPATAATIGGETVAMFSGTSNANLIRAGKLSALAVSGAQRSRTLPDVPTIAETYPGFDNSIWIGLFAPAGTPDVIVAQMRAVVEKALRTPELTESFNKAGGIEPMITTLDEMKAQIQRDQAKYSKVIRELNLKID
jgi:tripartite-type tricarboxylate transporter receptor subunit TctC